jgi:hypothetical protein
MHVLEQGKTGLSRHTYPSSCRNDIRPSIFTIDRAAILVSLLVLHFFSRKHNCRYFLDGILCGNAHCGQF